MWRVYHEKKADRVSEPSELATLVGLNGGGYARGRLWPLAVAADRAFGTGFTATCPS
jgi:hypothetical protein